MDGKGRWIDNVFIERLWRSVKYENIYLHAYENGTQLRRGLTEYFDFYKSLHTALPRYVVDKSRTPGFAVGISWPRCARTRSRDRSGLSMEFGAIEYPRANR